jgi:hypothetical protein
MANHNHFAFECDRCGETYPGEEEYNDHCQSRLCSRLECSLCQVIFPSLDQLLKHERFKHLWCSACNAFFKDIEGMHIVSNMIPCIPSLDLCTDWMSNSTSTRSTAFSALKKFSMVNPPSSQSKAYVARSATAGSRLLVVSLNTSSPTIARQLLH